VTDFWSNAIFSITPTILVGLIFWFIMRSIIRADRTERAAYAKIEAEERAKLGLPDPVATVAAGATEVPSAKTPKG
jgi:flagellar biosynthesis/type III secretory pathway M-ring protein FliF/YscJ